MSFRSGGSCWTSLAERMFRNGSDRRGCPVPMFGEDLQMEILECAAVQLPAGSRPGEVEMSAVHFFLYSRT